MVSGQLGFLFCLIWCLMSSSFVYSVPLQFFNSTQVQSSTSENTLIGNGIHIQRNRRTLIPFLNNETASGEQSLEIGLKNPNVSFSKKLSVDSERGLTGHSGDPGVLATSSTEPISDEVSQTFDSTPKSSWENPSVILSSDKKKEGGSEAEQNLSSPSRTNDQGFDLLGIFIQTLVIVPPPQPINDSLESNEILGTTELMLSTDQSQMDENSEEVGDNAHHNRNRRNTEVVYLSDKSPEFFIIEEENDSFTSDSTSSIDENEEMLTTEETMETTTDFSSIDVWDDSNGPHYLVRRSVTMTKGPSTSNGEDTSGALGPSPATLHHEVSGETKEMLGQPYIRFISQIGEDKALVLQSMDLFLRPMTSGGDKIPNPLARRLLDSDPMVSSSIHTSTTRDSSSDTNQMILHSYEDKIEPPSSNMNSDGPRHQIPILFLSLISPRNEHTVNTTYSTSNAIGTSANDNLFSSAETDKEDELRPILSRAKRNTNLITTIATPNSTATTPSSENSTPLIAVNSNLSNASSNNKTTKCTFDNNIPDDDFAIDSTSTLTETSTTSGGNATNYTTVSNDQTSSSLSTPLPTILNLTNSDRTAKTLAMGGGSSNASISNGATNNTATLNSLTNSTNSSPENLTSSANDTSAANSTNSGPENLTSSANDTSAANSTNSGPENLTSSANDTSAANTTNSGPENLTSSANDTSAANSTNTGIANQNPTITVPGVTNSTANSIDIGSLSQNSTTTTAGVSNSTNTEIVNLNSTTTAAGNSTANSTNNGSLGLTSTTTTTSVTNSTRSSTTSLPVDQISATTGATVINSTTNSTTSPSQNSTTTNIGAANSTDGLTESQNSTTSGIWVANSTTNATNTGPENLSSLSAGENLSNFTDNSSLDTNITLAMGNILSIQNPRNTTATTNLTTTDSNASLGNVTYNSTTGALNTSTLYSPNTTSLTVMGSNATIIVTNGTLSSTSVASDNGNNSSLASNLSTTNSTNENSTTTGFENSSSTTTSGDSNTTTSPPSGITINSVSNSSTTSNVAIGNGASIGNSGSITVNDIKNYDPIVGDSNTTSNTTIIGTSTLGSNTSFPTSFNSTIASINNSTRVANGTLTTTLGTSGTDNGNNSSTSPNSSNGTSDGTNLTAITTNHILALPLSALPPNSTISDIENSSLNSTGILNTSQDSFQSPSIQVTPGNTKTSILDSIRQVSSPENISSDDSDGQDGNVQIEYSVSEAPAHLFFAFQETVKPNVSSGSYRVLLPDGRTEIVNYTADDTGYHPVIEYINSNIETNGTGSK